MSAFTSALKDHKEVAERTTSFSFEKPNAWSFRAGQYVDVTLPNPPETDAEGNTRSLSISSAPEEEFLTVTMRLRKTAFKRSIVDMPIGAAVKIDGPFGNLTLHHNVSRPAVLIAGGIGITPFRSILMHAAKQGLGHRIFLFYSNRRPEDTAFLDEFRSLEKENPNFHLIATMTKMEESRKPWTGETGRIGEAMLSRYLTGVTNGIYYIAGPTSMVAGMKRTLDAFGVDEDDTRVEEFTGY